MRQPHQYTSYMVQDDGGEIDQLRSNADSLSKCLHALLERIEKLERNRIGPNGGEKPSSSPEEQTNFKDEQATIEDSIEVDPVTGVKKRKIVTERVLTTKTFHQLALDLVPQPLSPQANGRLLSPAYQSRAVNVDRAQLDQITVDSTCGQLVVIAVHPSSTHDIHPGDTITQVNGKDITSKQELEKLTGRLELTLVPAEVHNAPPVFYRMLENYNSEEDPGGCKWLPVDIRKGDVVQVMSNDGQWMQARKVNDISRVGYLPSSLALERVSMLAPYGRRVLVLLGAVGVGRRTLKSMLLRNQPQHFATVVPLTSRPPRKGEQDGYKYTFKRKEDIMQTIRDGQMIEWGELDENLYGTSADSIRKVIRGGRMCVVDCAPQALHYLYNREFMPFVVHIVPPPIEELLQLEQLRYNKRPVDKLSEICTRSDEITSGPHSQQIHLTLINRNLDVTFKRLIDALEGLRLDTQWVPEKWMS